MVLGPLEGHTGEVYTALFSADGRRIVSASYDGTICIWNSDTGEMLLGPLEGHTKSVRSAVFSSDGRLIVSASDDDIRVWDSQSGNMVLGPLKGAAYLAVFSADARRIVSYSQDRILIWDCHTGEIVQDPHESDDAKLSFTDSETGPYIITPPHSNSPASGTSSSSYSFSLERGLVAGVVDADIDTWLYADRDFLIWRYAGQLILSP